MSKLSKKAQRNLTLFALALAALVIGGTLLASRAARKIPPGQAPPPERAVLEGEIFHVEEAEIPVMYKAVGTLRSRDEVELSPRIVARILEVRARSGDRVAKGDVLIRLDDADLQAMVEEVRERAESAAAAAAAAREQANEARSALDLAEAELARMRPLHESGDLSDMDFDRFRTARDRAMSAWNAANQRQATAEAERAAAAQSLRQAQVRLADAAIESPMDGVVCERLADPGDMASPGRILMRIFDPARLMLETPVRESLVAAVSIGAEVPVEVPALGRTFEGEVREIVPSVDPGSRTFLVKICLGEPPGLMPGMFGTVSLPLGEETALLVPEAAVVRTGQVERVAVAHDDGDRWALVRTVPAEGGMRRVLAGLSAGEKVRVPK